MVKELPSNKMDRRLVAKGIEKKADVPNYRGESVQDEKRLRRDAAAAEQERQRKEAAFESFASEARALEGSVEEKRNLLIELGDFDLLGKEQMDSINDLLDRQDELNGRTDLDTVAFLQEHIAILKELDAALESAKDTLGLNAAQSEGETVWVKQNVGEDDGSRVRAVRIEDMRELSAGEKARKASKEEKQAAAEEQETVWMNTTKEDQAQQDEARAKRRRQVGFHRVEDLSGKRAEKSSKTQSVEQLEPQEFDPAWQPWLDYALRQGVMNALGEWQTGYATDPELVKLTHEQRLNLQKYAKAKAAGRV